MSAGPRRARAGRPIVVVGDVLLDRDVTGRAERLSPEAAAPVVDVAAERLRPGGAALTALLAAAGGRPVRLLTALAADEPARVVAGRLAGRVELVALPAAAPTPVKSRVRVGERTLLRLDTGGGPAPGPPADPQVVREALRGAAAVLVSDYGRGLTRDPAVRSGLAAAGAPLVWDPHPAGGQPVPGARLVTPNAAEAARFAPGAGGDPLALARRQAEELVARWRAGAVAITLGELGALLSHGSGSPLLVPAEPVAAGDSCGAGDAFAAAAAAALAGGALPSEAVAAAVAAAAEFVAAGGAAAWGREQAPQAGGRPGSAAAGPSGAPGAAGALPGSAAEVVSRVRARGGRVVATGGCFDLLHAGHVATLRAARRLGDALVVCLNSDESVRRLKGGGRPLVPEADRARVLGELACVDAVEVFAEDTPHAVLERLRPDVWVKGGDYAGRELPEGPQLARWGGQVVVLPYLSGRSTSGLVAAARAGRR